MPTTLSRLSLFLHAPAKTPARELLKVDAGVQRNWCARVEVAGADDAHAVCVIQGSGGDTSLVDTARVHLGERCVIDPDDDGEATRLQLADDMSRTFAGRGSHGEWNPYELWSSNNARRWCAGLQAQLAERGLGLSDSTEVETYGNWTGCHHKYTNFMARYLDRPHPALIHAEPELCTLKDFPMPVVELVESARLAHGVLLFLFRREDGAPLAQLWDGLRAVWEPPHAARVALDPAGVDLFTMSPNAYILPQGHSRKETDGFVVDVGDGAHPAYTTIVGSRVGSREQVDYDTFREALCAACVEPRSDRVTVFNRVEI